MAVHEFTDRAAAAMQSVMDAVERRPMGWSVTDQHQGMQGFEAGQALGKLGFAVFSRGIEWRGTRISEARNMMAADLKCLLVEVMQTKLRAKLRDLSGRLMIAGKNVNALGPGLKNFAAGFQAAGPINQVARREVVIRFHGH